MEVFDNVAFHVLKNNSSLLCSMIDPRMILPEAARRHLVSERESSEIATSANRGGAIAGMGKMLDFLLMKNEERIFELFVEVLENYQNLKTWADYLRDDYVEEQKKKMLDDFQFQPVRMTKDKAKSGLRNCKLSEPLLHSSADQGDVKNASKRHDRQKRNSLPNIFEYPPETQLLEEFSSAQNDTCDKIQAVLESYAKHCDVKRVRNEEGKSLLHIASETMNFRTVKLLIERYNFNPNMLDGDGNTALHLACLAEKAQIVLYLVNKSSCNPNIKNNSGMTPLHVAAMRKSSSLSFLMNSQHVDKEIHDNDGKTAKEIVEDNSKPVRPPTFNLPTHPAATMTTTTATTTTTTVIATPTTPIATTTVIAAPTTPIATTTDQNHSEHKLTMQNDDVSDASDRTDGPDAPSETESDDVFRGDFVMNLEESRSEESRRGCCCCRRCVYCSHSPKRGTCLHLAMYCNTTKTVVCMLFGILLGLAIIGVLIYYLITNYSKNGT